jgi:predicted unusual protein kinase regulating ubiquinone biosynthesis (AarF/ABC1/UbiB family)
VPIASASLGQVHCAEMRAGRPVAVKIHRPGVRQQVAMKLGEPGPDFDEIGFVAAVTELVDSQQGVVAKGIELGKVVLGVTRTASEHGVRIPADLSMLGKTLLNLGGPDTRPLDAGGDELYTARLPRPGHDPLQRSRGRGFALAVSIVRSDETSVRSHGQGSPERR